jgi:hypothetical protein
MDPKALFIGLPAWLALRSLLALKVRLPGLFLPPPSLGQVMAAALPALFSRPAE